MSKGLDQTPLIELVPGSIKGDGQVQAAAGAVQPHLDDITSQIPLIELYENIDTLPEPILRMLAWENRVYGPEWRLASTIEEKRALVKGSFELNKRRGTRWAVERIFELLNLRAVIAEWWEPGENGDPATFRIAILDVSDRGILEEELELLDQLIYIYKPLTRHNTGIHMLAEVEGTGYVHSAISFVTELVFQPARIGDIDEEYPVYAKGSASLIGSMTVA